jgi:hypothetical protein
MVQPSKRWWRQPTTIICSTTTIASSHIHVFTPVSIWPMHRLSICDTSYKKPTEIYYSICRRFETGGSLSRRVNVVACPSPDGSTRGRARRGEVRRPEMGVREVEIPRPSCSSRAQVGCACSRGLQASTREREASGPKRAPVPSSSPRGQPSLRGPWSFLL